MSSSVLIRHSLKTRLTLTTLIIFLSGIWSMYFYANLILRADMERLLGEQQFSTISMVAEQVERALEVRFAALNAAARLSATSIRRNPSAMQSFLQQRTDLQSLFGNGTFATGTDGIVTAAIPVASSRIGVNYMDRDYLARALRDGMNAIGQPAIGKTSKIPVVVMAAPIRGGRGDVIGALSGVTDLSTSNFLQQISTGRYGRTGGYLLVAPEPRLIIAASSKSRIMERLPPPGANGLVDLLTEKSEGSGVATDPHGVEVLYSVKNIRLAGWRAIAFLPTTEAFEAIRDLQHRMHLAALILTFLAGIVTWWVLRRQLSPLITTVATLAKLADSHHAYTALPVVRRDEIGQLIGSFNHLLVSLEQREADLRESEEHFRLIFENSGDAILFSLLHGNIESANPAACRLFGYSEDEFRKLGPAGIMDTADPRLAAAVRQRSRTGLFYGELRCMRSNGSVVHVEVSSTCFTDTWGRTHTINQLRDITDRKHADEGIRVSEARLRRAELTSKSGNLELHLDSRLLIASEGAAQIFGLSHDNIEFSAVQNILLPEYRAMLDLVIADSIRNGAPHDSEFRIRSADTGALKDIHFIAQFDTERGVVFGNIQDISERKQSEARLRLAAKVFTHVREGILITDVDGTIVEINDAFCRITGFSRDDAIGQNPRILKSEQQPAEFYASMWRSLTDQGHWVGEMWNRRKNGTLYVEKITISAVRDALGKTQHYVALLSDITDMKEYQKQLEHVAHYDSLTNLPNRVLLADRLRQAMTQCQRSRQSLAVVYIDLDDFKAVNDHHGHGVGDELLVTVARNMRDALREGDTLSRIGGDEFVAVLANLEHPRDCQPAIERLLFAAAESVIVGEVTLNISASIGVTLYPQDGAEADLLLRHADQALYVAKQSGKNRYHLFDVAQDEAVTTQRESIQHIASALDRHEFVLHFQPKVNMRSGEVVGAEALIRWQHPQRGLLPPAAFLPVIENHPLAANIGEWVIDSALCQLEQWCAVGTVIPISINVGAFQLQQPDFVDRLRYILAMHPSVRPDDLEIEILETSALEDLIRMSQVIKECRSLGVRFALDDFGTGYSSLTYLKRLPVSWLKVDQSFVRNMLDDPDDLAILNGVIGLASAFRHEVIAEGVETVEHGEMLLQLGCELAQGYGIARPMPSADFLEWARTWHPAAAWQHLAPISRDDLPLLFAMVEHRAWIVEMEAVLKNRSVPAPHGEHCCRFCQWLLARPQIRNGGHADFKNVDRMHLQAHDLVAELCEIRDRGHASEVLGRLEELVRLRDALQLQFRFLLRARNQ